MAGYIGSKASVTLVDGYTTTEADAEFLNQTEGDARYVEISGDTMTGNLITSGTVTANQFTGGGTIILVGNQSDSAQYSTESVNYTTASRFQITPSTSTSYLLAWFFFQMRAVGGSADGDRGNTARVHYRNSSASWISTGNLVQNLHIENGTSTGSQEISATIPVYLTQSNLNSSGDWDIAVRHYEVYDATSYIDDGRIYYMEYEP